MPRTQNGRGSRRLSLSSANRNGRRCSRLGRSSSAWRKSEKACNQFGSNGGISRRLDVARLASAATPQLQTLFLRPERLRDRHLDDAAGDQLAGLSTDPFGTVAWHRKLRGSEVSFALGPFAGVWVERLNRRKLLVWTQAAAALQSLAMAALTLTHVITLWEIMALTAVQGLINAFDMPGRQSFLVQMVDDRNDLSNAIAINSSMANGARLIGPAIAGLVISAFGEGWCFMIDGVSYFAVIASLLMMRIKPMDIRRNATSMFEQMREGWDYVRTFRPIRTILLLFAIISLMGYSYAVLLPVFAGHVLHGGAHTLRWLTAASGIGALVSGLSLAAPQVGRRADTHGADSDRDAGRSADSLRPVAYVVAIACTDGLRRLRLDAGGIRQQHDHPVVGARGQTRSRDGLLHDGIFRRSAVRQPAGRHPGTLDRSVPHRHRYWRVLHRRIAMVHA
ncbi:MAG TPA: MFS transporter [Candidatus Acidoferrum sp.]|nr:MFS transporter [Candidatus Acidoferrum sp.]